MEPQFKKNKFAAKGDLDAQGKPRFWYYVVLADLDEVAGRTNDRDHALQLAQMLSETTRPGEVGPHPIKVVGSDGKTMGLFAEGRPSDLSG